MTVNMFSIILKIFWNPLNVRCFNSNKIKTSILIFMWTLTLTPAPTSELFFLFLLNFWFLTKTLQNSLEIIFIYLVVPKYFANLLAVAFSIQQKPCYKIYLKFVNWQMMFSFSIVSIILVVNKNIISMKLTNFRGT